MDITAARDGATLTLTLAGRLDYNAAPALEAAVQTALDGVDTLIFDFAELTYLSSVGLRVLLSAQKAMNQKGAMRIVQVSKPIMDIFDMTGFSGMMTIEPALRQITTDGYTRIGRGVTGECYKIDEETLLKLYYEHISSDMARREKAYARAAFMVGIPTAISYDVVACGKRRGIIYEMLDAKTLSQVIVDEPDRLETNVNAFADVCRQIHTSAGDPEVFPKVKETCKDAIRTVDFLTDPQRAAIIARVDEIPDADTCVHGDLHTSNILMQNGDPCLIDMGDFSIGDPMFDIGQVYNIFYNSRITRISEKAVGMPADLAFRVWELFEESYFNATTDTDRARVREAADFYGCLRMFMFYEGFGKNKNMKRWLLERFVPVFGG